MGPNFLIVGAAKCGTTSLYEYLRQHPEVFLSRTKEPNFFAGPSHGNRVSAERYQALFARKGARKAVGEASVSYLYAPGAPDRIREGLGTGVRILILLRHPVDMAYSLWGHMVRAGGETLTFLEAVAAEEQRLRDEAFRRDRIGWIYNYAYLDRGRYARQVEGYLRTFGRERVRVWLFEEFFADPASHFAEVCRFLGVSDSFSPRFEVHKPTGPPLSRALQDAVQRRHAWKEPLKAVVPRPVRRLVKRTLYKANRWRGQRAAPIPPEWRAQLWPRLEDDVAALERLLGRSLDVWRRKNELHARSA